MDIGGVNSSMFTGTVERYVWGLTVCIIFVSLVEIVKIEEKYFRNVRC